MREYGEVRKRLEDEAAAPYIGFARTLLGQLKNDMSFANLSQGVRRKYLPDGVEIVASSMFGRDTIRIVIPPRPGAEDEQPITYVVTEELIAAGGSYDSDYGGSAFALRWTPDNGVESLPALDEVYVHAYASAIAQDTFDIFGYSFGVYTIPQNSQWRACYWDADRVCHDLGVYGIVVDVSDDGKRVLFWNYDSASGYAKSTYILDRESNTVIPVIVDFAGWEQIQGFGLSGDGKKATGYAVTSSLGGANPIGSSWLWEEGVGAQDIGHFTSGQMTGGYTKVYDISGDGTTIVGETSSTEGLKTFSLTDGVFTAIPPLDPTDIPIDSTGALYWCVPYAVSRYGQVTVGSVQFSHDGQDVRYYGYRSQNGVSRVLPKDFDNRQRITAKAVTKDGAYTGVSYTQFNGELYESPFVYRGDDEIYYKVSPDWIFPEILAIQRRRLKLYSDGSVEVMDDDEALALVEE